MKTQKDLIYESNQVLRGETKAPAPRKPTPPKTPAPVVVEEKPAPVKRRGRPRKANGTAAKTAG